MLISNMIKTLLYEKVVPLWDKLVSQELFSLKRKKKKKKAHLNHGLECYSMESVHSVSSSLPLQGDSS